jgi:tetratricopeptide (TPR) repeat protein
LRRLLSQARTYHDRGDHEAAAQLLRVMEGRQNSFDLALHSEYLRLRAWIQSRRGFLDGILALDELAELQPMSLSLINSCVCSYRYQGLIPPPAIEPWIERGREFLTPGIDRSDGAALPFLGHWGCFLLRNGRPEEALRTLQDACQPIRRQCSNPAAVARALADYGDACRALGQPSKAVAALEEAQCLQTDNQLEGDRSEFALTYRAKLETNPSRALELLAEAKAIQTRLRNVLGEARSTLLEARLLRNSATTALLKARLHELRGMRPALSRCRLLAKILDHWDAWTNGGPDPGGGTDLYWWL